MQANYIRTYKNMRYLKIIIIIIGKIYFFFKVKILSKEQKYKII